MIARWTGLTNWADWSGWSWHFLEGRGAMVDPTVSAFPIFTIAMIGLLMAVFGTFLVAWLLCVMTALKLLRFRKPHMSRARLLLTSSAWFDARNFDASAFPLASRLKTYAGLCIGSGIVAFGLIFVLAASGQISLP